MNKTLFSYLYYNFNNISEENIKYFKEKIKEYISFKGYKLKENFKIGIGNKGGKYTGKPIFIIQSNYILDFPKDKRLEISFGE